MGEQNPYLIYKIKSEKIRSRKMEKLEFVISFLGVGIISWEQGVRDLNTTTSLWLRLGWNRFLGKLVLQKAGVANEGGIEG